RFFRTIIRNRKSGSCGGKFNRFTTARLNRCTIRFRKSFLWRPVTCAKFWIRPALAHSPSSWSRLSAASLTCGILAITVHDGYVFVRPLFAALAKFEQSEPGMKLYFPDLVRSIDLAAERKRIATIKFAPRGTKTNAAEAEVLAHHKAVAPTTIPNDAEAIAALTEEERRIAEKNSSAAESSFQKVLVKHEMQQGA